MIRTALLSDPQTLGLCESGVCAVGVTDVDAVVTLKAYFESIETLEAADLPSQIDGIPVQSVVSGRFNAN